MSSTPFRRSCGKVGSKMAKVVCALCGKEESKLLSMAIADGKYICGSCYANHIGISGSAFKKHFGKPLSSFTIEMIKDINKDIIKKCNVCGQVFCYSELDLLRTRNAILMSGFAGVAQATAGSATASAVHQGNMIAQVNRVRNPNKCPQCGSTDLHTYTDEEWAEEQKKASAPASAPVSAADELKKFKELLDSGIITQEEFDAKKKQLLGL